MTPATRFTHTPATDLARIEDLTRREFMFGALGTALLIACGDDEDNEAGSNTRDVEDVFGTVTVPSRAQRVIAGNPPVVEMALALGVKPVGAWIGAGFAESPYLKDLVDGIVDVRGDDAIDLEKALALDPDLIIAIGSNRFSAWNEETCVGYKDAVATYCYQHDFIHEEDIRSSLTQVAVALGIEERAEDLLEEFDAHKEELKQRVRDAGFDSKPVAVIRISPEGEFALRNWDAGPLLFRSLGIAQLEGQQDADEGQIDLSMERLSVLNEAYAVVVLIQAGSVETEESLSSNAVWQSLTPVQEGRVIFADGAIWNTSSILGVIETLNEIETKLLPLAEE